MASSSSTALPSSSSSLLPRPKLPPQQHRKGGGSGGNQHTKKTLTSLFRHWSGLSLTVELKTGRLYHGILTESDDFGNLTLEDVVDVTKGRSSDVASSPNIDLASSSLAQSPSIATFAGPWSSSSSPPPPSTTTTITPLLFASLYIRGPTIRYIHFSPDVDLWVLVRQGMDRERAASQKYTRATRKSS